MRGVSQISPPIRILAVAALALIAAWMLVLRPSDDTGTAPAPAPATAPGVTGLGKAVDSAKGAAAAQEKRDAQVQQATGEEAGTASKPAAAEAARKEAAAKVADAKPGDLPLPVLKAVADQKIMVLLFWNPKSADDRAVRRAVAHVDRWNGRVFVRSAPIGTISKYGRITRGVDVEQSPTVVVVDHHLNAEPLVGYVDTRTIDQAVVDAMRNSGVLIKDPYLAKVNKLCSTTGNVARTIVMPDEPSQVVGTVKETRHLLRRLGARFAAIKAPARFRGFKRATMADHRAYNALATEWLAYLGPKPSGARVLSSLQRFAGREGKLVKRYDRRMDAQHLLSCGSNG